MCFTGDYDWMASISNETVTVAAQPWRCGECRRTLEANTTKHTIYQQEHEECGACESGDCECPEDACCSCEEPSFGETFEYSRCDDCNRFLEAIQAAELEAGCGMSESRPPLTAMKEELREQGPEESVKYYKAAKSMFPELKENGYLVWLWKSLFTRARR